jgi:hypothetical protein
MHSGFHLFVPFLSTMYAGVQFGFAAVGLVAVGAGLTVPVGFGAVGRSVGAIDGGFDVSAAELANGGGDCDGAAATALFAVVVDSGFDAVRCVATTRRAIPIAAMATATPAPPSTRATSGKPCTVAVPLREAASTG